MQSKKSKLKNLFFSWVFLTNFYFFYSFLILFLLSVVNTKNVFMFMVFNEKNLINIILILWFIFFMNKKNNNKEPIYLIYRSRKFISNVHGWNKAFNKITNWNKLPIFFYMTKIWTKKSFFFLMFIEYKYYSTSKEQILFILKFYLVSHILKQNFKKLKIIFNQKKKFFSTAQTWVEFSQFSSTFALKIQL